MAAAFADISTLGTSLFDSLASPPASLEDFLIEVGPKAAAAVESASRLANALPPGLPANTSELPADVLNWLTVEWLRRRHSISYFSLRLVGAIRNETPVEEVFNGAVYRTRNSGPKLSADAVVKLLDHPEDVLQNSFWSVSLSDNDGALAVALELWSMVVALRLMDSDTEVVPDETFDPEADPPVTVPNSVVFSKKIILADGVPGEAGVTVERVLPNAGGPGALVTPFGDLTFDFAIGPLRAELGGTLRANPIRIDQAGIQQVDASQLPAAFDFKLSLGDAASPALSLGNTGGLQVQVETLSLLGGLQLTPGKARALVGVDVRRFNFSLSASDGDGFLAKILPPEGIAGEASVVIEWSTDGGVAIRGGGGLSIALPIHIQLGPLEVRGIVINVRLSGREIPIEVGATFAANLGPLAAVVEQVGVSVGLSVPDGGGNVGPLNAAIGFKPPKGVGLSIDAGVVKGGGYLFFDFDREEYAGALELTIAEFLSLKAIGLVTTRMPDGSRGFSLLIIITAEFSPGLQLGFGFNLIGVGGLLGLNRTVVLEALALGVRTGAVNGIMFPVDPVANAPRIISDLRTIFPPYVGHFLIGPMAKIGWGPFISLALG